MRRRATSSGSWTSPASSHAENWVAAGPDATYLLVELHLRLPGSRAPASAAWDRLAARRTEIELCGQPVAVLDAQGRRCILPCTPPNTDPSTAGGSENWRWRSSAGPCGYGRRRPGSPRRSTRSTASPAGCGSYRRRRAREGPRPARHGPARLGDQARREPTARHISPSSAGGQAWTAGARGSAPPRSAAVARLDRSGAPMGARRRRRARPRLRRPSRVRARLGRQRLAVSATCTARRLTVLTSACRTHRGLDKRQDLSAVAHVNDPLGGECRPVAICPLGGQPGHRY